MMTMDQSVRPHPEVVDSVLTFVHELVQQLVEVSEPTAGGRDDGG
jgi:hypothetical protein